MEHGSLFPEVEPLDEKDPNRYEADPRLGLEEPRPSIQGAAAEYTRWRKHPHSYMNWFVDAQPSDDQTALVVTYRHGWISPAEIACASYGKFMGWPIIMQPAPDVVQPQPRARVTLHDRKCPGCGYPCVRCHGKM